MKRLLTKFLIITCMGAGFHSYVVAQSCEEFFKRKGYCTDYVEQRTGKRQRGNAGTWKGNIPKDQMRAGDVAIFSSRRVPPVGHVAVIERVIYKANTAIPIQVEISEYNWGRMRPEPKERACSVTFKFGEKNVRTISVSAFDHVWRPR